MIPRAYIYEWQQFAPWQTNAQVEQDLVIGKGTDRIFSNNMTRNAIRDVLEYFVDNPMDMKVYLLEDRDTHSDAGNGGRK